MPPLQAGEGKVQQSVTAFFTASEVKHGTDKTFYAKWIEQKEIYLVGEFGWDNPTEEYKFTAHPTKPGVYTLTKHFNKRDLRIQIILIGN